MAELKYQNYEPLYINGRRDRSRRYVRANNTNDVISVREFQKQAHIEAGSQRAVSPVTLEKEARRKEAQSEKQRLQEQSDLQRYYRVINRAVEENRGLSYALRKEGMSRAKYDKINEQREHYAGVREQRKVFGKLKGVGVSTIYQAQWLIPSFDENGRAVELYGIFDQVGTRTMAFYWQKMIGAVHEHSQEVANTAPSQIVDTNGNIIELITNIDVFVVFADAMGLDLSDDFDVKIYLKLKGESLKVSRLSVAA